MRLALLQPQTFMNLSGRSVAAAMRFYKLGPDALVVVHDEIDLTLGDVRAKSGGGLAGHNGLRSLRDPLGTAEFVRVRIGVGRPERGDRQPVADWLRRPFPADVDVDELVSRGRTAPASSCATAWTRPSPLQRRRPELALMRQKRSDAAWG